MSDKKETPQKVSYGIPIPQRPSLTPRHILNLVKPSAPSAPSVPSAPSAPSAEKSK